MQISPRDKIIVFAVIAVLIGVAFIAFGIVPQFGALKSLDSQIAKAESDAAQARTLLSQREQAKGAAAETQAEMLRLDNQVPETPELPALIIDLQQAANDAGVDLDDVSPSKPADASGYRKIEISFSAEGQWEDVLFFLRGLQSLQRGIRVTNLSMQPPASTDSTAAATEPKVTANVKIEAYTIASSGAAPQAGSAPAPVASSTATAQQ